MILYKFSRYFLFAITISIVLPAFAEAPTTEKPTYKPGDKWEFKDKHGTVSCQVWEIIELSANTLVEACDDYQMHFKVSDTYDLQKITQGGRELFKYEPGYPGIEFPIKVGKKWSGKYSGYRSDTKTRWNSTVDYEVKAYEDITVAAGTFKAYKIEFVDNWVAGQYRGSDTNVGWYVPEVGYYVKRTNSSDSSWNHELTGYKRN